MIKLNDFDNTKLHDFVIGKGLLETPITENASEEQIIEIIKDMVTECECNFNDYLVKDDDGDYDVQMIDVCSDYGVHLYNVTNDYVYTEVPTILKRLYDNNTKIVGKTKSEQGCDYSNFSIKPIFINIREFRYMTIQVVANLMCPSGISDDGIKRVKIFENVYLPQFKTLQELCENCVRTVTGREIDYFEVL